METNFKITKSPVYSKPISLNTVYSICSDKSYSIDKTTATNKYGTIALRTVSGSGLIKIKDKEEMVLYPNSLILFNHCDVERYMCRGTTWDFWWFNFTYVDYIGLNTNVLYDLLMLTYEQSLYKRCLDGLIQNTKYSNEYASAIFSHLLYQWKYELSCAKIKNKPYEASVHKVIDAIHRLEGKAMTVKQMARIAGFSERRFREIFKKITNQSPKQYYDSWRLERARGYITNTSLSMGEIASKLGYSNQYHFSREFKKAFKVPPSKYL